MSKSKGNVVTPVHLLDQYGADAVRYWAASARLGTDTAFDEKVFKVGRRLATKLFNAAKFVLAQSRARAPSPTPLDRAFLARLRRASSTRRPRASTSSTTRTRSSVTERVLLGVHRQLPRAGEGRASARRAPRPARLGRRGAAARARRAAAAVRAVPAVRHRGGLVVVARGLDPPGGLADRRRSSPGAAPGLARSTSPPRCSTAVRKEKALAKVSLKVLGAPWSSVTDTAERLALGSRAAEGDVREAGPGSDVRDDCPEGEPPSIVVVLGEPRPRLMRLLYDEAIAHLAGAPALSTCPAPRSTWNRALVDLLDHPELTYPTIHVTGTNGKSTPARAAAAVACAHELTTGRYLLLHLLVDVTERFAVCGEDIGREEFADEWTRLEPYLRPGRRDGDG